MESVTRSAMRSCDSFGVQPTVMRRLIRVSMAWERWMGVTLGTELSAIEEGTLDIMFVLFWAHLRSHVVRLLVVIVCVRAATRAVAWPGGRNAVPSSRERDGVKADLNQNLPTTSPA